MASHLNQVLVVASKAQHALVPSSYPYLLLCSSSFNPLSRWPPCCFISCSLKHLDTCVMCFHTCLTVCLVWGAYRFRQVEILSKPLDVRTGTLTSGTDWRYKFGSCPHTCVMKQSESLGVEEHNSPRRRQRKEDHRLSPAEDDAKRKASKETKMKWFKDAEENHSVL